ncbi:MATE family efflux transporter [Aquiflexum sp. LQ15W]|uniref:lipopolysaccharide biosynthesis protein n=1 Tax=Cognataquiflexum nitidum TaxID=2922272 RepID=UPI001F147D6F|nr:MATE family efflux transporter [Cognataquiflexum nitidum]MCH6198327.1 MATE family efflux transporter [Cognataquiflexum nitidum]
MIDRFFERFRGKHSRSVAYLLVLNGVGIIVNLLLVPLLIEVLDSERYGVWLTVTTLILWMNFLDVGLGHGLRNKLAESLAAGNKEMAVSLTSTAYFSILVLVFIFCIVAITIVPHISWTAFLNAPSRLEEELNKLVFFVILIFSIQFFFKLITSVFQAIQKPEGASLINTLGLVLGFLTIWFSIKINLDLELWELGIIITISPLIVMIAANIAVFRNKYSFLRPRLKFFNKDLVKPLFSLGGSFFVVQITALLLFQSNNLIIAHTVGPSGVTEFNIAFKYLGVVSTVFYLINMPFWSASTEAFAKKNHKWVMETIKKLNRIWAGFVFVIILLIVLGPTVYSIWLGGKIEFNIILASLLSVYYLLYMQWSVYGSFINGSGKLRVQMIATLLAAIIHIPLAYFLGKSYGINGVVISMIFVATANVIWPRIQIRKLITESALGIWNK